MWAQALLAFTLATLTMFPSSTLCDIHAAPAPTDSLSIVTPDPPPVYGLSFTFQWAGNSPNFTLKLFDMTPKLVKQFSNIPNQSYTWSCIDIPTGTELYIVLTDALLNSTYSEHFTIGRSIFSRVDTLTGGTAGIFCLQ